MVISLRYYVEAWAAALGLFRFARSKPQNVARDLAWQWQWIAVHECVMQISFLNEAMEIIRAHRLRPCPTVIAHLDKDTMRSANKSYNEYFPNMLQLRHAIAHQGYVGMSGEKHRPADEAYALSGFRNSPDRFETVYEGVWYHLDITDETLRQLAEVVTTLWRSFHPVEKAFDQIGRSD